MALPDFVLVRAFDGANLNLISLLTDLSYGSAIDAAPTITASIHDPDGDVLNAHRQVKGKRGTKTGEYFFDRNADGELDAIDVTLSDGPEAGKTYRLTQFNVTDSGLDLEFEARSAARLRKKYGHVVAKRGRVTRAEFVRALIKKFDKNMPFYSRELHDTQPKAKGDANGGKDSKEPGIKKDAHLKVKNVRATSRQMDVAEDILTECAAQKCSEHVMVAAIMCAIQESVLGKDTKLTGNDDVGVFQQGRNWISLKNIKDIRKATRAFLLGHEADVGGTDQVKGWKQVHGSLNEVPGGYESAIKKVQGSVGGYSPWQEEAEAIVEAFGGADVSVTTVKSYQFEVQKGEDFWTAIQRLAEEVNWRAFVHNGVFYFMDDYQLLRGRPQYTLAKKSPDVVSLNFQFDDTQKFPNEASIAALTDNWTAYPGDVVDLIEAGPATGRWIVKEIGGDYFSPQISVTLYQPTRPKKEPANETEEVTNGGLDLDGGAGGSVVKGAIKGSPVPGQAPHASTHDTDGLPGYPAYDYMAPAGTPCVAPVDGRIARLSGKDPSLGGAPGGALGYSIYLSGSNGKSYFMTHLDKVKVKAGQTVRQGQQIAEVANGPRSWSSPHVHMGVRG